MYLGSIITDGNIVRRESPGIMGLLTEICNVAL